MGGAVGARGGRDATPAAAAAAFAAMRAGRGGWSRSAAGPSRRSAIAVLSAGVRRVCTRRAVGGGGAVRARPPSDPAAAAADDAPNLEVTPSRRETPPAPSARPDPCARPPAPPFPDAGRGPASTTAPSDPDWLDVDDAGEFKAPRRRPSLPLRPPAPLEPPALLPAPLDDDADDDVAVGWPSSELASLDVDDAMSTDLGRRRPLAPAFPLPTPVAPPPRSACAVALVAMADGGVEGTRPPSDPPPPLAAAAAADEPVRRLANGTPLGLPETPPSRAASAVSMGWPGPSAGPTATGEEPSESEAGGGGGGRKYLPNGPRASRLYLWWPPTASISRAMVSKTSFV